MDTGAGTRCVPSRYADDPRVTVREEGGYTAVDGRNTYTIISSDRDRWMICLHPSEQPMPIGNGCFARYMDTPVQAIAFAIGQPVAGVPAVDSDQAAA